jgi:hypothetical protein
MPTQGAGAVALREFDRAHSPSLAGTRLPPSGSSPQARRMPPTSSPTLLARLPLISYRRPIPTMSAARQWRGHASRRPSSGARASGQASGSGRLRRSGRSTGRTVTPRRQYQAECRCGRAVRPSPPPGLGRRPRSRARRCRWWSTRESGRAVGSLPGSRSSRAVRYSLRYACNEEFLITATPMPHS